MILTICKFIDPAHGSAVDWGSLLAPVKYGRTRTRPRPGSAPTARAQPGVLRLGFRRSGGVVSLPWCLDSRVLLTPCGARYRKQRMISHDVPDFCDLRCQVAARQGDCSGDPAAVSQTTAEHTVPAPATVNAIERFPAPSA